LVTGQLFRCIHADWFNRVNGIQGIFNLSLVNVDFFILLTSSSNTSWSLPPPVPPPYKTDENEIRSTLITWGARSVTFSTITKEKLLLKLRKVNEQAVLLAQENDAEKSTIEMVNAHA
jgi:hypothetical protein